MKNSLVIIGFMGSYTCYLNISVDAAIQRYIAEENDGYLSIDEIKSLTRSFEFDDKFGAYDVHPV